LGRSNFHKKTAPGLKKKVAKLKRAKEHLRVWPISEGRGEDGGGRKKKILRNRKKVKNLEKI